MCKDFAAPISASLRPGYTAPFEEMPQRWRAVGNIVPDLTAPRFKPQTSRSRDERPTGRYSGNSRTSQLRNPFIFYCVTLTLKSSVNAVNSCFVVAGENGISAVFWLSAVQSSNISLIFTKSAAKLLRTRPCWLRTFSIFNIFL